MHSGSVPKIFIKFVAYSPVSYTHLDVYKRQSFTIMNNPDGPLGFWLSMIPFTSPVAMIARIPFGVPVWQIALSMVLLIFSTLLMIYIAAKV